MVNVVTMPISLVSVVAFSPNKIDLLLLYERKVVLGHRRRLYHEYYGIDW